MNFKNKKFYPVRNSPPQRPFGRASAGAISNGIYLIGLAVILAGLVFRLSVLPVWAHEGCQGEQNKFSFSKFLNPLASLAEKPLP